LGLLPVVSVTETETVLLLVAVLKLSPDLGLGFVCAVLMFVRKDFDLRTASLKGELLRSDMTGCMLQRADGGRCEEELQSVEE
jgi:hypothetical protein